MGLVNEKVSYCISAYPVHVGINAEQNSCIRRHEVKCKVFVSDLFQFISNLFQIYFILISQIQCSQPGFSKEMHTGIQLDVLRDVLHPAHKVWEHPFFNSS